MDCPGEIVEARRGVRVAGSVFGFRMRKTQRCAASTNRHQSNTMTAKTDVRSKQNRMIENKTDSGKFNEVKLLLVEDDALDVVAIRRALKKNRIANPLKVAKDGLEALDILRGTGCDRLQRPYLILLDLNMPRMNGIEFLTELRDDPNLRDSIVFVLTTSDDDADIIRAYENLIAGYMVKSKAGEDFFKLIGMLDHYWRIIEFPPGHYVEGKSTLQSR